MLYFFVLFLFFTFFFYCFFSAVTMLLIWIIHGSLFFFCYERAFSIGKTECFILIELNLFFISFSQYEIDVSIISTGLWHPCNNALWVNVGT